MSLPRDMFYEIFRKTDHQTQGRLFSVSKESNELISSIRFFCYECAEYHPAYEMQDFDCAHCGGRKCRRLHGGEKEHSCSQCGAENLCADCSSLGRCHLAAILKRAFAALGPNASFEEWDACRLRILDGEYPM